MNSKVHIFTTGTCWVNLFRFHTTKMQDVTRFRQVKIATETQWKWDSAEAFSYSRTITCVWLCVLSFHTKKQNKKKALVQQFENLSDFTVFNVCFIKNPVAYKNHFYCQRPVLGLKQQVPGEVQRSSPKASLCSMKSQGVVVSHCVTSQGSQTWIFHKCKG